MAARIGCLPIILVFIILALVPGYLNIKAFYVFGLLSLFAFTTWEFENSLDRVYCGREIAQHKAFWNDFLGFFFLALEITFDVIVNLKP
jgi:hypothetical protein